MEIPYELSKEMRLCIDFCRDCGQICKETLVYSLHLSGPAAAPEHIEILTTCARVCDLAADMMTQSSIFYPDTCALCADICEACGEACDLFDDKKMRECSSSCQDCAKACRDMEEMQE